MLLTDGVEVLAGVGAKRATQLRRMGIVTIFDLLTHFPRAYENQSVQKKIADLTVGAQETVIGEIVNISEKMGGRRALHILTATIQDETGAVQVTWFNQKFLKKELRIGRRILVHGKVSFAYGGRGAKAIAQLNYQLLDGKENVERFLGIQPVYALTGTLKQNFLRELVQKALAGIAEIEEILPAEVLQKYELLSRQEAFYNIHEPKSTKLLKAARKRLAFEELYLIQCGLGLLKKEVKDRRATRHSTNGSLVRRLLDELPFTLTKGQATSWREVCRDMESSLAMRRMLQGDVGSGKTVIAMLALLKTVESGYQGALMAPTEILASQHFENFQKQLRDFPVRVAFLSGKMTKKQKENVYAMIQRHEVDIVIGTHTLLQEGVSFHQLGLVITDEQHRFGIQQRAKLEAQGDTAPDVLVMTATPIPRTMMLTVYGDLDVSSIRELPPGRKPIRTFVRTTESREKIYQYVRRRVEEGRQAYVVCPIIERKEGEDSSASNTEIESVEELYEELSNGIFYGISCAVLHGKQKQQEKEAIMQDFHADKIKILISTTVIEVGVNVPNAAIMVIENAERFGLAQLHQLRGRIGRGEYQSYCILVSRQRTEEAKQRLAYMENISDGFQLAEADLKLRGPGQFFGTMQHGLPDLKIADVVNDMALLILAREAAVDTMKRKEDISFVLPILALQYNDFFGNIRIG